MLCSLAGTGSRSGIEALVMPHPTSQQLLHPGAARAQYISMVEIVLRVRYSLALPQGASLLSQPVCHPLTGSSKQRARGSGAPSRRASPAASASSAASDGTTSCGRRSSATPGRRQRRTSSSRPTSAWATSACALECLFGSHCMHAQHACCCGHAHAAKPATVGQSCRGLSSHHTAPLHWECTIAQRTTHWCGRK